MTCARILSGSLIIFIMTRKRGLFIVIDGPSGTGKDTLIRELKNVLSGLGSIVYVLSEEKLDANRSEIKAARKRGKDSGGTGDKEMVEPLIQHRQAIYRRQLIPLLECGIIVIGNRGEATTIAYQTAHGELTMQEVWDMHRENHIPLANLVILTNCDPMEAYRREQADKELNQERRDLESGPGLSGTVTVERDASFDANMRNRVIIHRQYGPTAEFLHEQGVPVVCLDTGQLSIEQEVALSLEAIRNVALNETSSD